MFDGTLNSSKLNHKPDTIKKLFKNVKDSIVATADFYIFFPERYTNKRLAVMGSTIKLISIFGVVDRNMNYGVVSAPVFIDIIPGNVTSVLVDGVINKVIEINKGDVFVMNRNLIKTENFMYDLFDEFFLQGKVPWYIDYQRLSGLFLEASKYAGSNIGNDLLAMEIITSIVSRKPGDKGSSYRENINSPDSKTKPVYVGLNNIYYSYDNTLAKVMGGYMQQGVTTAIVDKEKKPNKVSVLLRS